MERRTPLSLCLLPDALETTPLLDVLQIIAYSQQSGLLSVKGDGVKGLVIFENGNVVCAYSPSALNLLVKAAKEKDPDARLPLRRIQALAALRELFEQGSGDYRFVAKAEKITELQGLEIGMLYEGGALDTGDLLLALEKAMDEPQSAAVPDETEEIPIIVAEPEPEDTGAEDREHQRFGPTVIRGTAQTNGGAVSGYLTNVSEGGTFFHAEKLTDLEGEMELYFELPWDHGACQARCKVAWVRSDGPTARRGVGLSFLEFSPDSKERMTAYLRRFQELAADVDFEA